jgi:hypothetical protein
VEQRFSKSLISILKLSAVRYVILLCCPLVMLFSSCGDSSDSEPAKQGQAVIKVGDVEFTRDQIIHKVNTDWPVGTIYGGTRVKPPRYSACLARRETRTEKERAFALRFCKELYEPHERFAAVRMVEAAWIRLETRARGIDPTDEDAIRGFERLLDALPPATARRLRQSQQELQRNLPKLREVERARRLAKALGTSADIVGERLTARYRPRTWCIERYRRLEYSVCSAKAIAQ